VPDALAAAGGAAVVVPLLLSAGYHVSVDLPAAVREAREAAGGDRDAPLAPALGPHPLLADALVDRLRAAGWRRGGGLVLAAAGSSDLKATAAVHAMARLLARRTGTPVVAGFASGTTPTIADAVAGLRRGGARSVAVASYLIAPGQFHDLAAASGADVVGGPLADHDALARLMLRRYDTAAVDIERSLTTQVSHAVR
jgi:sirohydrochlorin ferrochelatase